MNLKNTQEIRKVNNISGKFLHLFESYFSDRLDLHGPWSYEKRIFDATVFG